MVWTKEQNKEYQKEYYLKNKAKILINTKKWKKTPQGKNYAKGYREKNKEKIREHQKEFYQKNKDKILQRHKEWKQKNKERIREWTKAYDIKIRKHKKCKYCGTEFIATLEHPIYCSDECSKASKEEYYPKNKERLSARHKEYWKEYYPKNKAKVREKEKEWYQKNIGRARLAHKEWYLKHIDRLRLAHKEYYEKNKDKMQPRGKEYRKKIRQEFLLTYKTGNCCAKCGWKEHPEILQFHHRDKKMKEFTIGNLSASKRRSPEFQAEVKKCVLLCPNCHSLLHIKHRSFK